MTVSHDTVAVTAQWVCHREPVPPVSDLGKVTCTDAGAPPCVLDPGPPCMCAPGHNWNKDPKISVHAHVHVRAHIHSYAIPMKDVKHSNLYFYSQDLSFVSTFTA